MAEYHGIDVSHHQGRIDWQKVKASGKKFVMIRAGWSWYEGGMNIDNNFAVNMKGAADAGLDIGVYLYSYDKTPAAAKISAQRLLEVIAPYRLTYPVAFDIEDSVHTQLAKSQNTAIVQAFLGAVEAAGYYGMLYTYTSFANTHLDLTVLTRFDKWIADYRATNGFKGSYGIWQYTGSGNCAGISTLVDLNVSYKDYPTIIKQAGLNGWGSTPPKPPSPPPTTTPPSTGELEEQLAEAIAQRDDALAQLKVITQERDEALSQLTTLAPEVAVQRDRADAAEKRLEKIREAGGWR